MNESRAFIQFGKRLKFFYSTQFLADPLGALAAKMKIDDFKQTTRFFPDATKLALTLCKGAYPYNYTTSKVINFRKLNYLHRLHSTID